MFYYGEFMWFWFGLVIGSFISALVFFFTKTKGVVVSIFVALSLLTISISIGWKLGGLLTFGMTPICLGFLSGCTVLYSIRYIVNRFKKKTPPTQDNKEVEMSIEDAQIYYLINRLKEIKEENSDNDNNT